MTKKWLFFYFLVLIAIAGIYFHTNTLEVTHHKIELREGIDRLRIAHVTDLHTKGRGRLEEQLINALRIERPDIIVITGDLATPSGSEHGYDAILKKLAAPKGVYFVQGNWEYWEPIKELKHLLHTNNIQDLTNSALSLGHNLWLVGFDDSEEGHPDLAILDKIPESDIKIGLFHSPHFFEQTAGSVNLNLAGHSHGGQLRIPFLGHVWVPDGTGTYDQGWFEKDNSKLFVSRGIGTSVIPIRFNCAPELAIIDVSY